MNIATVDTMWMDANADVLDWIKEFEGTNSFARSLAESFRRYGRLTGPQCAAVRRDLKLPAGYEFGDLTPAQVNWRAPTGIVTTTSADEAARLYREYAQSSVASAVSGIDLTALPSGRYAVPDSDGRLKVKVRNLTALADRGERWHGYIFVNDAAEYGHHKRYGIQRPGSLYQGEIHEALRAIMADPKAATVAYGRLTSHCGVCGLPLENAESIARGIGPICAARRGYNE